MDNVSPKITQWINEGKDPRSAHWQGGLEAILEVFSPCMEPGNLVPVQPLEKDEISVFKAALAVVDLSPTLTAAFIPPAIAGQIIPPEPATELQRVDKGKPSYKILISRPGKDIRILCAEISAHAKNPGVEILQSGALLGTYDFNTQQECLDNLTKTIRTHIWKKDKWSPDEVKKYTINWFEKIMYLGHSTVSVKENFSFFHSPTLIKGNKIDALFFLIAEVFLNRCKESSDQFKETRLSIKNTQDKELQVTKANEFIERNLLEFLSVIQTEKLIKFDEFSSKETERFKTEFSKTLRWLVAKIFKGKGNVRFKKRAKLRILNPILTGCEISSIFFRQHWGERRGFP